MSKTSKAIPPETLRAAEALLKRMKGEGWKLRIWENIGWHYCVENHPFAVHPCGDKFHVLMGDNGTGECLWHEQGENIVHQDPNEVVRLQLEHAKIKLKAYIANYQGLIDAGDRVVGTKKKGK